MKRALNTPQISALLLLLFVGSGACFTAAIGGPKRLIKVNFYVDNKKLLDKPFLEVSLVEDKFRKKIIGLEAGRGETQLTGVSDIAVPDGPVHLYVCGIINCHNGGETEMRCGQTLIPSSLDILSQHEVTFSTAWACKDGVPPF